MAEMNEEKYCPYFSSFSYELSAFQKQAIAAIVDGNHVLVSAPTGSGKTLPAEFAIDYFTKMGKRVIYTSPIKALSNQKYYDFSLKFPDITIGLCTGDIKTNTDAQLILMTAEILTNQLFHIGNSTQKTNLDFQMDIATELGVVIMDEVHYINDEARGKTWEQTIMMLPIHIQMVMLSATLDDPYKFARWIDDVKMDASADAAANKKTIVALTNHRIVPLTHYGYIASTQSFVKTLKNKETEQFIGQNTNRILRIQDSGGKFDLEEYKKMQKIIGIFEEKETHHKRKFVLNSVAEYLKREEMLPAIVFTLSRSRVESDAADITTNLLEDDSKVPYTMARECEAMLRSRLTNYREYLELAEYRRLVALLEKGVGIHHSGMIPILREIVEMQISRGTVKLLFATESFAIGLNCPIKTAVFSGLTKYDGSTHRYLYPHEYTQMAGRAGRRGIDTVGHVVHLLNLFDLPLLNEYKTLLSGKPQTLVSKFQIDYSMVLHLIQNNISLDSGNFAAFFEKSMGQVDIKKRVVALNIEKEKIQEQYREKTAACGRLQTPLTLCLEYIELEKMLPYTVNKKRKEVERKMAALRENKWLIQNLVPVKEMQALEQTAISLDKEIESELNYMKTQTVAICKLMEKEGFIEYGENQGKTTGYELSHPIGKIATYMNELHPLVMAKLIVKWSNFQYFSVEQIAAYLSIFADIRVGEDHRYFEPKCRDAMLMRAIQETDTYYFKYKQMEIDVQIQSGFHYELVYDLADDIILWCGCEDEIACRNFIIERLESREISLGDFVKAILKICAIGKEWRAMCQCEGDQYVELEHKLSKMDGLLLKYITTSQSLYV